MVIGGASTAINLLSSIVPNNNINIGPYTQSVGFTSFQRNTPCSSQRPNTENHNQSNCEAVEPCQWATFPKTPAPKNPGTLWEKKQKDRG